MPTFANGESAASVRTKINDAIDKVDGAAAITSVNIDGGAIDGVTLGTNSAVTEAQIDNININGNAIISTNTNGNIALTPNGTGEVDISKVDIDGGTIDGTTIGAASAAAGTFTTANATTVDTTNLEVTTLKAKDGTSAGSIADSTGVVTLASSVLTTTDINGGTIDGTVIGGSTPAAISGTTGSFSGNLTVDTNTLFVDAATNRVGIGTTTAARSARLTVKAGNSTLGSGDSQLSVITSDAQAADVGGSIVLGGQSTAADWVYGSVSGRSENNSYAGYLAFGTSTSLGAHTERMRIDSSGNVGIGTTNPAYRMTVNAASGGGLQIENSSDTNRGGRIVATGSSGSGTFFITSTSSGYPLTFGVDNTERMRIDNNGDISFYEDTGTTPLFFWDASDESLQIGSGGTANPAARLIINDAAANGFKAKLTSSNFNVDGNWIGLGMGYHNNYMKAAIIAEAKDGNARANLHFCLDGNANVDNVDLADSKMVLTYAGNVGIGTTSPATTLDVNGDVTITDKIIHSGDTNTAIRFPAADTMTVETAGTERMRITSAGNVGIGTSSPRVISGYNNLVIDGSTSGLFEINANGTRVVSLYASGNDINIVNPTATGAMQFYTNDTERMRIDSSGNVLIGGTTAGTASAGNLVLVNGTAPTGNVTNGITLYAEDVSSSSELKVRDEAGNVTTLSPHNFDLIPEGPSEEMAWSYYSERDGKRINVDMLKAIRLLEQITGEKLVHIV